MRGGLDVEWRTHELRKWLTSLWAEADVAERLYGQEKDERFRRFA